MCLTQTAQNIYAHRQPRAHPGCCQVTPFSEAGVTRLFQIKLPVLLFNVSIYFLELAEPFQFKFKKIEGLRLACTMESFCLTNLKYGKFINY